MNATFIMQSTERTVRLRMDSRTLAEQDREILYLRRRLEKLAAVRAETAAKPAPSVMSSTQPSLAA